MSERQTLIITRLTFREAARKRILVAALALGVIFLVTYALGVHFIRDDMERQGQHLQRVVSIPVYSFLATTGLYVVNFLTLTLTVLTSVDTIAGEIDSGTVHVLAAKPVRRRQILLGKWLGYVAMVTLYLIMMAGGVILVTRVLLDYAVPHPWRGLALLWLSQIVILNITLLGGTRVSTLANGVLTFATYGVAFIGGWIEQIGGFLGNETTVVIGIISSLLMPSEALWRRASFEMQSALTESLAITPFSATVSVPSLAMVVYAIVYAAAALGLAVYSFNRRDL